MKCLPFLNILSWVSPILFPHNLFSPSYNSDSLKDATIRAKDIRLSKIIGRGGFDFVVLFSSYSLSASGLCTLERGEISRWLSNAF